MYQDINNAEYDYVIFGTSLVESTLSAYLAKLQKKILHIDISVNYGGDCKNLNLQELEKFITESQSNQCKDSYLKQFKVINRFISSDDLLAKENYRNYNFDLNPKFLYAKSKSTEELTSSNTSSYLEFMSVSQIYFYYKSKLMKVPFSKSEIFSSNDLELIEKQTLLAFLYAIMKIKNTDVDVNTTTDIKKDYELDNAILANLKSHLSESSITFLNKHFSMKIQAMITLILADIDPNVNCDLITVDELITKIYKFLLSVQIYDNTPYLYPLYGSSEFSQAFCRKSSLYGTIFLVNETLKVQAVPNYQNETNKDTKKYLLTITDWSCNESFSVFSDCLIINEAYLIDQLSPLALGPGIVIKNINDNKKVMRFVCLASIKQITELRKDNDGPIYYKVRRNDEELANCYGFTAIEYFNNTHSVPKHRSLLEIIIMNEKEEDEEVFIENCKKISQDFISRRMEDIGYEITKAYSERKGEEDFEDLMKNVEVIQIKKESIDLPAEINASLELDKEEEKESKEKENENESKKSEEEKAKENEKESKEEENEDGSKKSQAKDRDKEIEIEIEQNELDSKVELIKPKLPQKEKISLLPHIILQYDFLQICSGADYEFVHSEDKASDIIITKNSNKDIDLDFYFNECEAIIKAEVFVPLGEEPKLIIEDRKSDASDDINLIDELFKSINISPKESKAEEEPNSKEKNS